MSDPLYQWFSDAPARYWLVALPVAAFFLLAAVFSARAPRWLFLLLLGAALLAFRWPPVVSGDESNVDESQTIAAAITLGGRPVFWRDVDTHAIGPLAVYPLTLLGKLGAPFDYQTARLFGLLSEWLGLACLCWLLREYFGEHWSRLGILPAAGFLVLARHADFLQYSSEAVGSGLTALGAALAWVGVRRQSRRLLFGGGICLAATAWVKLQAAPVAIVLFLGAALALWRAGGKEKAPARAPAAPLVAGFLAALILPLAVIVALRAWGDWFDSYIRAGFEYLGQPASSRGDMLWRFLTDPETVFPVYAWTLLLVLAAVAWPAWKAAGTARPLVLTFAASVVVGGLVVATPGRYFPHYLILVILPLGFLVAACAAAAFPVEARNRSARWKAGLSAGWIAVVLVPQVLYFRSDRAVPFTLPPGVNKLLRVPAAEIILQQAGPGDAMTVWGWEPRLHVMTGLPQAVREAHTQRVIEDTPMRDFYRARFLADFRRNPPALFVDGIVSDNFRFNDRGRHGFALWPEFGRIIALEYRLVGSADGYRIYRRLAAP